MKTDHLFEAFGVELAYMLVDRDTLNVLPETDRLLAAQSGETVTQIDLEGIAWSHELTLHQVELKLSDPVTTLDGVATRFVNGVQQVNALLEKRNACLMPTGAHPWMNPDREARLWPHEGVEICREFERVFEGHAHGWTNVQSMHLNLPFADDEEFGRLHAAIRLVLPILPALAASTPLLNGKCTGLMDSRLEARRTNARKVPAVAGRIIPEPIFHIDQYQESILQHLYGELAPNDPRGILRYQWLNARGAIPRFERNTFEIRVMDLQECPSVDLAVASAVVSVLRGLVDEQWSSLSDQQTWSVGTLRGIMMDVVRDAENAVVTNPAYLRIMGVDEVRPCTAGELWQHLVGRTMVEDHGSRRVVESILNHGCLARRILQAAGHHPERPRLHHVYAQLCACLAEDRFFYP